MLELAILGILKDREVHGYELKRTLTDTLGPLSSVSFGSLYPALRRLEAAGALEALEPAESAIRPSPRTASVPMTGSLAGEAAAFKTRALATSEFFARRVRSRKVYRITPRGRILFAELLSAEDGAPEDDRAFHLKLTFARYLSKEDRLALLHRRRSQLLRRLNVVRATLKTHDNQPDTYVRSLIEHRDEATRLDILWLDGLISTELGFDSEDQPRTDTDALTNTATGNE